MKTKTVLLTILMLAATAAQGGPRPHPWHYIKTHKELLAADALSLAAIGAAYGASVHCQSAGRQYCVETNGFLPAHPSQLQTAALSFGGYAGSTILFNHLIWHFAPKNGVGGYLNAGSDRHLLWMINVPIELGFAMGARDDANTTERIQNCFAKGLCKAQ